MILTEAILNKGKSSNNGWNLQQLECFGCVPLRTGWRRRIIGQDFPEETINKFLQLRNVHLKVKQERLFLESEVIDILKVYEQTRESYICKNSEPAIEDWFNDYTKKV